MKHSDKYKNLESGEAVEKLQELVKHNSICMFATFEDSKKFRVRPMAAQKVDDEGNLWFLSAKGSLKNQSIESNPEIQLFFSNPGDNEFLSITGEAEISTDRQRIEDLWNPIAKAWFTKGKDDPTISAIKVVPTNSYYWDTRHGKMISMLKIAGAALTGSTMNEGVQGKLEP